MPCSGAGSNCFVSPYCASSWGFGDDNRWGGDELNILPDPDYVDEIGDELYRQRQGAFAAALRRPVAVRSLALRAAPQMSPAQQTVQRALIADMQADNYIASRGFRMMRAVPGAMQLAGPALMDAGYGSVYQHSMWR